ncbi:MAG: hypothetical protein H0T89_27385 [Deltaproteobacteria bacterium]|nr:hypothetical protein [Deltaproteobacteria bacterium]MDQ3299852.1 hypothetical protein [Myxococcota bacterium]
MAMLATLASVASVAAADDGKPELHKMRFIERGQNLTVTANPTPLAKLFDSAAYAALDSGFTSTVVIRIWIYPQSSTTAVAFVPLERQVVYNLWDEVFELRIDGRAPVKEKRQSEALKRLTAIEDIPVARLANLPPDQVFLLAMQVELNPVSKKTLAEVRRWLSQGTGGGLDRGGAFFGSFVSVFVNPKIPEADRVLRIRSQPFYRPRP